MKNFRLFCLFALTGFILAVSVPLQAQTVSLRTLLDRLTETPAFVQQDNDQTALFAAPKFTCKQASSYDRAAVSPTENWFANADTAQFIRQEKNNGRDEWVLIDAEGPGAIVRWWITAPHYKNNFRIYIDGNPEPVITGNIADIVGGEQLTTAPLSSPRAGGRDLYLPIPYAKNIKITCDNLPEQGNLYYQINYLTFEPGTEVESFSLEQLNSCADQLKQVNQTLLARTVSAQDQPERTVLPGKTWNCGCFLSGGIQEFSLALKAEDMACATRNTIVCLSFDEEETVWCPVSEFFGTGVGVNPYKTWFTEVKPATDSGFARFTSFWTMPFKKNAKITIMNLGKQPIDIKVDYTVFKADWSDDFMYFHCNWRQQRNIKTIAGEGTMDWNYLTVEGRGVYVGDVLSILNPVTAWWGEGDEKIFVDGEAFPSHFGTGTEDYYGYAWGTPAFFEAPYHAQPRAEGPGSMGNVTNLRFRNLDRIPFEKSLKFDMEVWHWASTSVNYTVAAFWYGAPGAKAVNTLSAAELLEEASQPVSWKTPLRFDHFELDKAPEGSSVQIQGMGIFPKATWKHDEQLFWTGGKPGDILSLKTTVEQAGPKMLTLGLTLAVDYGIVQFYLDDRKIGQPVDLFNAEGVIRKEVTIENLPELAAGEHLLKIEIIDKNENSTGYFFGIDGWEFE